MLAVKPIADISVARGLCSLCGVTLNDGEYTYFAADVNEDATKINYIIGVCTLVMKGDRNEITAISYAPEVEDEEALIIMARTVMNFMFRCEVKAVTAGEGVSDALARKLGFSADRTLDLVEFYKSPCKFNGGN